MILSSTIHKDLTIQQATWNTWWRTQLIWLNPINFNMEGHFLFSRAGQLTGTDQRHIQLEARPSTKIFRLHPLALLPYILAHM